MYSILDVVLFIRNNTTALNLSTIERLVLFTLAGRIGNNPSTWVTQAELADELCIKKRHLIYTLNSLKSKKIIQTTKKGRKNHCYFIFQKVHYGAPIQNENPEQQVHHSAPMTIEQVHHSAPIPENDTMLISFKSKITNKSKITKARAEKLALPDWLPKDVWNDFLEHRKAMKSPMSQIAQKKAINALDKLGGEGFDIIEVINQSIVHGWKGLFPVRRMNNIISFEKPREKSSVQKVLDMLDGKEPEYGC